VKELKDYLSVCPTVHQFGQWNPVKELKDSFHTKNHANFDRWNPVESGEGIESTPEHLGQPVPQQFVESGEGIESEDEEESAWRVSGVESGEGIESSIFRPEFSQYFFKWNPVKELKGLSSLDSSSDAA